MIYMLNNLKFKSLYTQITTVAFKSHLHFSIQLHLNSNYSNECNGNLNFCIFRVLFWSLTVYTFTEERKFNKIEQHEGE